MKEINYKDYIMETREKRRMYYSQLYNTFKKRKKREVFIPNEKDISLEYTSKKEEDAIKILKNISENWDEYWGYGNRPACDCETCDLHKRTHYFYLPQNLMRPW